MPKVSKKNTRNLSRTLRRKMRGGGGEVPHIKARGKHPQYPERFSVPDDKMSWSVEWSEYTPINFTHQKVIDNDMSVKKGGWADPANVQSIKKKLENRITYHPDGKERTLIEAGFLNDGTPRYPVGRTGMTGRGLLGKWGPNHAVDPIVTRYDPERPNVLQMVAIQRSDTDEWAIPGGMVDPGKNVFATEKEKLVKRKFMEKAGNVPQDQKENFKVLVSELFSLGDVVYSGCVDDPRNTDNAWMETTAFHFHCNENLGKMLPLFAGDDVANVMWLDVDVNNPKYDSLYASHRVWVDKVKNDMNASYIKYFTNFDEVKTIKYIESLLKDKSFLDAQYKEEKKKLDKIYDQVHEDVYDERYDEQYDATYELETKLLNIKKELNKVPIIIMRLVEAEIKVAKGGKKKRRTKKRKQTKKRKSLKKRKHTKKRKSLKKRKHTKKRR